MKLAFICTEMLPSPAIKGGAIQIMIDGVAPLLARRHDLTIYSITDPKLPNLETRDGIRYIRFPASAYVGSVARSLSKHAYDVVHVFNRPRNVSRYKAAAPASKFVVSLHNDMFNRAKLGDSEGLRAIRDAEKIITVSDYIGSTVTQRFPSARPKVQTVYSGFDLSRYRTAWDPEAPGIRARLLKKYGLTGKKVVLFVGRLTDKKGPHILIKAMKEVWSEHPDAALVIVGGKWFSDNTVNDYVRELYAMAKPYGNKIKFTKFVPADQIPDYYLMADVFVCSSQWQEPLARVHYEAMAAGVPIVTTDRGGNAEVIRDMDNGLVVQDYWKPSAFARNINYLLSRPDEARRMAINGRRFVEDDFTFEHVADRLDRVYEEAFGVAVASRRRSRRR
ncbi:glycosyltransferase family 4 protein [Cohnella candidum]|uniref:Glycosyltransferase family 1 protein n=1 Tax=Cohnella candidum TaxID=2674991 RepID=A0A3G3JYC2_9BACL|nr:glycosyltransferase family 4 protein [Cohnella candidum]AYQ73162.1 glycosyltransferase family 1 protein [Cohnella candidum]